MLKQAGFVKKAIRTVVLSLAFACLMSLASWTASFSTQPSYAAPQPTTSEAQLEQREQAYEEAKAVAEDPKKGVEKEYEKAVEAYEQEHSSEGSLLDKAKEIVTETTGSSK